MITYLRKNPKTWSAYREILADVMRLGSGNWRAFDAGIVGSLLKICENSESNLNDQR